jgi:DNA-binding transcriptional LysR family regulator
MELYQLRTFVMVARQGNLTSAAELLHMSQPAASTQVKAIESEFEIALFERRAGGLALTKLGETLLPLAERILAAAADFTSQAKALRGRIVGKLRFGTVIDPVFLRLGDLVTRMLELHPMLGLEIHQAGSGRILEAVRGGDLDAGYFLGKHSHADVDTLELCRPAYRIVAAPKWRERISAATCKQLAAMPWICTPRHGFHYQMLDDLMRAHHVEPAKVIEADQESIIYSLVASGAGLALVREDLALAAAGKGEVILWPGATCRTSLSLIHAADRARDPEIQALRRVIVQLWQLTPPEEGACTPDAPLRPVAARALSLARRDSRSG